MNVLRAALGVNLVAGCLAAGWWLGRRGVLTTARASRLTRWLITVPAPVVLALTLWTVRFDTWRTAVLPLIGAAIALSMLPPAWCYARAVRFSAPRTGSMLTCALFSNLGYLGAFTAFALFGEEAYGLCLLFLLFFNPCFYTLGFAIAGHYGHRRDRAVSRPALADDLKLYPFVGLAVGIVLNLLGVRRPPPLAALNHILIPVDTALYLTAIGSQVTFGPVQRWLGPSVAMSLIKFLYAPAVGWLIVTALGIQGLTRFIILLEASTPVGVSVLIFPMLFGLDRELSNALWLFTTLLAIPWLLLVIPLLQAL